MMTWIWCLMVLVGAPLLSQGAPQQVEPAAVAAGPVPVAAAPVAASPAEVSSVPATSSVPVKTSPAKPVTPEENLGNGIITEHKNPDGSTITVTRYNGPLPANAFQSPLAGFNGLHDVFHRNFYQTQLLQLQTQQAINQALLRNMNSFQYSPPVFSTSSYPYSTTYTSFGYPYNTISTSSLGLGHGFFGSPFLNTGPYGFFPFGQPVASRHI